MSPAAEEWDKKHRNEVAFHVIEDGKFLPINRPCDWCGLKVKKGYIHAKCAAKEQKWFLDIIG